MQRAVPLFAPPESLPLEHDPEKWKPVSRLREALASSVV
jgi:hypothetical protein